jgi:putative inorganic carbon (hco3(-)) transporter
VGARVKAEDRWPLLLLPAVPILVVGVLAGGGGALSALAAGVVAGLLVLALYATAYIDLAWLFSGAIALTVFSGHWRMLGFPNLVSPDRLLLGAALIAFLVRDPALGRRPRVRLGWIHVLLLLAAAFALCSAMVAGTVGARTTIFPLLDRFGLVPFLLFTIAPAVFATDRQRRILAGTLTLVGAYLGLMALFQGLGLDVLVYPNYLLGLTEEVQLGRARGPFLDAAINGYALFCCAVVALIAFTTAARPGPRRLALAVAALCIFDLIFTQERSVWVGAVAAALCAGLAAQSLRRRLPQAFVVAAFGVVAAFLLVPGLHARTSERLGDHQTEWDRLNLNKAAENMIVARPLLGFGFGTFRDRSSSYFQQNPDFPLTNTGGELHNVFLASGAELGLIGATVWVVALASAIGGAIFSRGPPELYWWRIGLIAVAVMWLVLANLTPLLQAFPNQLLWLLAGVAWPCRFGWEPLPGRTPPQPINAGEPPSKLITRVPQPKGGTAA